MRDAVFQLAWFSVLESALSIIFIHRAIRMSQYIKVSEPTQMYQPEFRTGRFPLLSRDAAATADRLTAAPVPAPLRTVHPSRNDRRFERFVIFNIFQCTDQGLRRNPRRIALQRERCLTCSVIGTCASANIATVGLNLSKGKSLGVSRDNWVRFAIRASFADPPHHAVVPYQICADSGQGGRAVDAHLVLNWSAADASPAKKGAGTDTEGGMLAFIYHAASSPKRWTSR